MTTHFISAEIELQDSLTETHQAIAAELQKRGEPLRWAVTEVDPDRHVATIEAVVLTEPSKVAASLQAESTAS